MWYYGSVHEHFNVFLIYKFFFVLCQNVIYYHIFVILHISQQILAVVTKLIHLYTSSCIYIHIYTYDYVYV